VGGASLLCGLRAGGPIMWREIGSRCAPFHFAWGIPGVLDCGEICELRSPFFLPFMGVVCGNEIESGVENWFWNMTHRSQYWRPINRTGVSRRVKSGATYPEGRVFKLHGRSVRWNSHLLRNLLLQRTEQGKTQTTKLCWKTLRDGPWAGFSAARK
jgi:hypothetical protein